ncbi:hypothetical protein ACFPM0_11805 [Pseudonocardia sulfidoxydans]
MPFSFVSHRAGGPPAHRAWAATPWVRPDPMDRLVTAGPGAR